VIVDFFGKMKKSKTNKFYWKSKTNFIPIIYKDVLFHVCTLLSYTWIRYICTSILLFVYYMN